MSKNTSIPLGGIALIERVEKRFGLFARLFDGLEGKARDFLPGVKLHVYNKLTHAVSTHQIAETYSPEIARYLGTTDLPSERSLYRALERIGRLFPILMERYQQFISQQGLVDSNQ